MAHSVVVGHPLATSCQLTLYSLPCLLEPAHTIYSKLLPECLKRFPQPDYLYDYMVSVNNQVANCVTTSGEINTDSLCLLPWTHKL